MKGKVKIMRPEDCVKYCNLRPQAIREALKAQRVDFGFATNPTGKRWSYVIIPSKFFNYIGLPIPEEWSEAE